MAYQRSLKEEWNKHLKVANRSSIIGYGGYKANALTYQGIAENDAADLKKNQALARARGAASGALGTGQAREHRAKLVTGRADPGNIKAPTFPSIEKPIYEYSDPREGWKSAVHPSELNPDQKAKNVRGYDKAYQEAIFKYHGMNQGWSSQELHAIVGDDMYRGLNEWVWGETSGKTQERNTFQDYGTPADSPANFNKLKSAYDTRYSSDMAKYEELNQLRTTTEQIGSASASEFAEFQTQKERYSQGSETAKRNAAASGGGIRGAKGVRGGGGEQSSGPDVTDQSPGLAWIKRDDTQWI